MRNLSQLYCKVRDREIDMFSFESDGSLVTFKDGVKTVIEGPGGVEYNGQILNIGGKFDVVVVFDTQEEANDFCKSTGISTG